ncbi:MAG: hypothetical protein ACRCX7_08840 [Cetobacterium sp.]|uniref:hypothetical protein n=1 Tax=Cetobacterium sp. TaxID=2071632 RepID=UPI003F3F30A3
MFCGNCGMNLVQMRAEKGTENKQKFENETATTILDESFDINIEDEVDNDFSYETVATKTAHIEAEAQREIPRNNQKRQENKMNFDDIASEFDSKSFGEFIKNLILKPFDISTKSFKNNLAMVISGVCILAIAIMGIIDNLITYIKTDTLKYIEFGELVGIGVSNILNVAIFYGGAVGLGYVFLSKVFKERITFFELLNIFVGILIMHSSIKVMILLANVLNIGIISSIGWGLIYLIVFPSLIINVLKASEKKTEVLYSLAGIMIISRYIALQIVGLFN